MAQKENKPIRSCYQNVRKEEAKRKYIETEIKKANITSKLARQWRLCWAVVTTVFAHLLQIPDNKKKIRV